VKKQHLKYYIGIIVPLTAAILLLLWQGSQTQAGKTAALMQNSSFHQHFTANSQHPVSVLLLQIIVILICARLTGYLFTRLGQQAVMGEIAAGIILGPSFFGWLLPDAFGFVFPPASLSNLQLLSQIGLVLFMFIIGMEIDFRTLRAKATEALLVSHVSMVFPYFLGVLLGYFLFDAFAPKGVTFLAFGLFMGISMSITAFPVLARILQERNMTKTPVGKVAIISAAVGDITAWGLLPFVIAISRAGDIMHAWSAIILVVALILVMFLIVRPTLQKLSTKYFEDGNLHSAFIAIVFLTILASAYLAEIIGVHALFGAFLAGCAMPDNHSLRGVFAKRIEDVSVLLLLPLFFAFTGLRTQLGVLNTPHLWLICGLIIVFAVTGKFGGGTIAAKLTGQSWKDSLSIGALMNTRGLMELIVLNIGYDLGILTPEIFTMMVFMALTTTFMTSPILNLLERKA
jgi:Kef-type K+ transport system membrane component KefB